MHAWTQWSGQQDFIPHYHRTSHKEINKPGYLNRLENSMNDYLSRVKRIAPRLSQNHLTFILELVLNGLSSFSVNTK